MFGASPTTFSSAPEPGVSFGQLRAELATARYDLGQLRVDRTLFQKELADYRLEVAGSRTDLVAAREALALARAQAQRYKDKARITWGAFQFARSKLTEVSPKTMDDESYDRAIASLEQEVENWREKYAAQRKEASHLQNAVAEKDADVRNKATQIESQAADLTSLRDQLKTTKDDLEHQKLTNDTTDELLQNAYADTQRVQAALEAARDEKSGAEAAQVETQLQLDSLRKQWDEEQEKSEELARNQTAAVELEKQFNDLCEDVNNIQGQLRAKDHLIEVKDARIAHLEGQLQRALTTARTAEATAEAAKSPTAEPVITFGESLESELSEIGGHDVFDGGSEYADNNEFVGVIHHATIDIPPIEPQGPALSLSAAQGIDTVPIQPERPVPSLSTIRGIDTTPIEPQRPTLTLSAVQGIDTIPIPPERPVPSLSAVQGIDTVPIEPQRPTLGLSAVQGADTTPIEPQRPTITLSTVRGVDTIPIEPRQPALGLSQIHTITETAPDSPRTRVERVERVVTKKKPDLWLWISALLALLCAYLWARLQAWKGANSYHPSAAGAYGSAGHFLGLIPFGWDIGDSYASEAIARSMAIAIQSFEAWAGIHRAVLH